MSKPLTDQTFSAFDYIDAVVLVADAAGNIVFQNKAVNRIFGFSREEVLGDGWWHLVTDNAEDRMARKQFVGGMAAGIIDPSDRRIYQTQIRAKDGRSVWLQWTNSRTEQNLVVGVGQVITEKMEMEEQLKRYSRQVELLHVIDKQLLSILPLEIRIGTVLQELEKNISFVCRATLAVFNIEKKSALIYRKGKVSEAPVPGKFEIPLTTIGSVDHLAPGKIYVVEDLRKKQDHSSTDKENLADGIVSYMAVPLFYREMLMGALFLCSDVPNPFNEHDREMAGDVANSLALAIEQNQLEQILVRKNAEKELLLKEIHHRVKNNLQIISSLLNLQSASIADPRALEGFRKSKDRIFAMALIHTRLYESGDLSSIEYKGYLYHLVNSIAISFSLPESIKWEIISDGVSLDMDNSINLGLIITELVSNCFKHAFRDRQEGWVKIMIADTGGQQFRLSVSDNGCGLPLDFDPEKSGTLGLEIVRTLVEQMEGTLEFSGGNGTAFHVYFRLKKRPAAE